MEGGRGKKSQGRKGERDMKTETKVLQYNNIKNENSQKCPLYIQTTDIQTTDRHTNNRQTYFHQVVVVRWVFLWEFLMSQQTMRDHGNLQEDGS